MPQVLIVAFALLFVANGAFAAVAPERWVRSRWTLSGTIHEADLEDRWKRFQIRVMGVVFGVAGLAFASAGLGLSSTDALFGALGILFFGAVTVGCVATFIAPERHLFQSVHRWLPETPAARRICLLLLRLFALFVLSMIIRAIVSN